MLKFALLNFKRTKKSWRLLMGVMILAYTFLTMLLIFFSSMHRSEEEQRERLYGSWHVALINTDGETMRKLEHHATLERMGASRIYGRLLDQEGEELGKAGTADSNTMQMENIELMEGRFPQAEDEAAVERSSLSALGIEPRLGETIEARLSVRDGGEETVITRTYKVVGILQDYSEKLKGTTPDKHDYVTLLVTEQSSLSGYGERWNLVCRLQEKYLKDYRDITAIREYQGTILANNYTYFSLGEESEYQWRRERGYDWGIWGGFLLVCSFFVLNEVRKYLETQQEQLLLLHRLGKKITDIRKMYVLCFCGINVLALIAGGILGIIFSFSGKDTLHFNYKYLGVSGIFANMFINILVIGRIYLKNRKILYYKKHMRVKKVTVFFTLKSVGTKSIIGLLMIWGIGLLVFYEKSDEYNKYNEIADYDYKIGNLLSYYPISNEVTEEQYKRLKKIYGIEKVSGYRVLNYIPFQWEFEKYSNYREQLKETFWKPFTGSDEQQVFILGIDSNEMYDYYVEQLDEGSINSEDFQKGESVILFLPDYYILEENNILVNSYDDFKLGKNTILKEEVQVGDYIEIKNKDYSYKVKVDGIIRSFKDYNYK